MTASGNRHTLSYLSYMQMFSWLCMHAPGGRGEEIISKRAVLLYEVGTASKLRVLPNINSNFKWPLLLNRTEGNEQVR